MPRLNGKWPKPGPRRFKKGLVTGVPRETLDSIARNGLALKSPLETPVGYGGKSANVTLRKYFELYANIRPVRELPGVTTPFTGRGIDMVIVRENVEDVYAGIEHMQTTTVAQCLKLMTAPGCERVIRAAYGLAEAEERKKVTTATKANIMKLTEGLMKRVAEKVGPEFPNLKSDHIIIDNCAHQLRHRAGKIRCHRDLEHERRHHLGPRGRAGRRIGHRALV